MNNLVESIEFRAKSPRTSLPGLDAARQGLRAISAELDAINGKLSGLSTMSVFKRTKAELSALLKEGLNVSQRIPVKDVAKVLGIPDIKDFQAFVQRWKTTHKDFAKNYLSGSISNMEFRSGEKAAEIARKYLTSAGARAKDQVAQLQSLLSGGGGGGKVGGKFTATVSGDIPLIIPAARIIASIGPGNIQVQGSVGGGGGGGGRARGGGGGSSSGGAATGTLVGRSVYSRPGKADIIRNTYLQGVGQELEIAEQAGNEISRKLTTDVAKRQADKFRQSFGRLKQTLAQELALPQQQRDYGRIGALREDAAATAKALLGSNAGAEIKKMGGTTLISQLEGFASTQGAKAMADKQRGMVADAQKTFRIREELAKARERGDKDEAARLNAERRQMEKRIASQNRMLAAGQKSSDQKAKAQARVDAFNQAIANNAARQYVSHAAAERGLADFLAQGGQITSERFRQIIGKNGPSQVRTVTAEKELGNKKQIFTANFDAAGASVSRLTKQLTSARNEAGYLGADFLKNTAKVTLWAASVGVLYKSLELMRFSLERVIAVGEQYRRLDQVFKQVGGSTQDLTEDVLHLAAVNGRSTDEAMQSALQWARLGLTRAQVNEAVRVSMMAANDANISAEETTEKLQAVMQTYNLSVGQLRGTLGEIVQITNSYNVSTGDMLEGLSRTAAAAKQAGLPLAELMGLLGATVGSTGQSGANIGNAIKSVTLALSNPVLQQKLRSEYRFEATTGGEEIKNMSGLLGDLYVKYMHLNDAQRQSLLFSVAGRTQANRLEAMLDNYVKAQTLAINAQLNLNTAEEENRKIKAALATQLKGLTAEWERFVIIQGSHGPVQAITQMTTALRNLLTIFNMAKGIPATGVLALLAAGGMKTILTGMRIGQGGFLGRTGANVRAQLGALNQSSVDVFNSFMGGGIATNVATRGVGLYSRSGSALANAGMFEKTAGRILAISGRWQMSNNLLVRSLGNVTRALGVGFVALRQWALPMIAITVATVAFNKAMESIGASSEKAEQRLAGMNEEAQRAAAAANAFAEAADALRTIQEALKPQAGFSNIRPEDARRMLSQGAELMYQDEPNLAKRERMTQEMRKQLDLLNRQGRTQEIQNILENRRNDYIEKRKQALQQQYEANKRSERAMAGEIDRLSATDSAWYGFIGRGSRQNEIAELKRRQQETASESIRISMEQNNAFEERLEYDVKHQTALEKHKLTMQSIAEIFDQIGTNNPLDKALVRIASLNTQLGAIQGRRKELADQDDADLAVEAQRKKALEGFNQEEQATREKIMQSNEAAQALQKGRRAGAGNARGQFSVMMDSIASFWYGESNTDVKLDKSNEEYATLRSQLEDIERRKQEAGVGRVGANELGFASRQKQRAALDEEERSVRAQLGAAEQNLPMFQRQTLFQFGQEQTRRDITRFGFGFDETDRLQRQMAYTRSQLNQFEGKSGLTIGERSRQLELETQYYHQIISLRERAAEVEREINQLVFDRAREMQRSLLEAGPSELLRKLAAFRTAFDKNGNLRNLSAGQLMAMSPDFRRDVTGAEFMGMASGHAAPSNIFDMDFIRLLNERNRGQGYASNGPNNTALDKLQTEISQKIGDIAGMLAKEIPTMFQQTTQALDSFADKLTDRIIPALEAFALRLDKISGGSKPGGQYGGTGGAAGNISKMGGS